MIKFIRNTRLLLILFFLIILLAISCTEMITHSENAPPAVSWVSVKTGLTDSSYVDSIVMGGPAVERAAYAERLDSTGFQISWNRVESAAYYEIRVSREKIDVANWNQATFAKTVTNNDTGETITTELIVMKPEIDGKNCTACEYCVSACPHAAITIFKNKAVIDLSKCTGCGLCYDTCDYNAVTDLFMGQFYYFGVQAFTHNKVPSIAVATTLKSYTLRYQNSDSLMKDIVFEGQIISTMTIGWCGHCNGAGCYINQHNYGPGCPVDAIYTAANGATRIDQSKCIYCGICIRQCSSEAPGFFSIRRVVLSNDELASH